MRLYVEELKAAPLVQVFTRETTALVPMVRLHLCKYLSPAGTYAVTLKDGDGNVLTTASQTLAQMQASSSNDELLANYFHGFVTFAFERACTLRPGVYSLEFSVAGYTYDDDEFLGWVKADTDRAIAVTDGSSPPPVDAPYDFELYALERVR